MKAYRGHSDGASGAHVVEVLEDGELVALLQHHAKHSPTGISWGYSGSGPADLARSLLIDHLGGAAWCRHCKGAGHVALVAVRVAETGELFGYVEEGHVAAVRAETGEVAFAPSDRTQQCSECWGEKTSFQPGLYQQFKFDVIAKLPQHGSWTLTAAQVADWLMKH